MKAKILKTNFSQKQEKQIEKYHNCSTNQTKETKSQKLGKNKRKSNVFVFFFKETK